MCECEFCGVMRDDLMYFVDNMIICDDCFEMFKDFGIVEKKKQAGERSN